MVRDFARKEIAPHALEWDENQHFPRELFARLGELGMLGVVIPETSGGAGLGYVEYVAILEEIGAADGAVGLSVAAHNSLCTNHLYLFGSDDLKREYLPRLASGEWIGAWGLTETPGGLGLRRHPDHGGARRRRVGAQRIQDLHHPRHGGRCRRAGGSDLQGGRAPRHLGLLRAIRPSGGHARQEGEQARHARIRHLLADSGGLPGAGGPPSGRDR